MLWGCGGDEFSGCDGGNACENAATGGAGGAGGKGGSAAGGKGGTGGSTGSGGKAGSGGGATGGAAGAPGSAGGNAAGGSGGTSGTGSDAAAEFPRTPVLDDFNRIDGPLGPNWLGNTGAYLVSGSKLGHGDGSCAAILWHEPYGVEQEVFATLADIDTEQPEMNVVLKAQELSDCELLEVMYDPINRQLDVTYCTAGQWSNVDGLPLTIVPGTVLGARALAGGELRVYVDGVLVKIFDISEYPHHALGGRIGVNCESNSSPVGHAWDDFGGG